MQIGFGGLTDQSRAQFFNQQHHSSGSRLAPMLAPFGYASNTNLLVLSTGGGIHNNPLQSNMMVEVDEFKFSKIIQCVILKKTEVCPDEVFENSCSLSDLEYDEETELTDNEFEKQPKAPRR